MEDGLSTHEAVVSILQAFRSDGTLPNTDSFTAHLRELGIYPGAGMPLGVVLEYFEENRSHSPQIDPGTLLATYVLIGSAMGLWVELSAKNLMPNETVRDLILDAMPVQNVFPMVVSKEWEEKTREQVKIANEKMEELLGQIGDVGQLKEMMKTVRRPPS